MTAHALRRLDAVADLSPVAREPVTSASGLSVTARWLEKSFGKKQVLRGINVHVPAGQFVAIVGRSGCGKSTLLRLLLNLDQPTGGEFWFGDREGERPGPRAVRVMFQEPRLLPWASVLANVEVGLGEERRSSDARERALAALREVGLADRRDEWPSVLSGGQKQRVALARALVSRPRVLAFDEPLGALDALTRISMQRLLERVWLDQRFTAIMVTHDVAEAVTLADRVLMIEDGEIALDLRVDLPRLRERGSVEVAKLEGEILRHLFRNSHAAMTPDPHEARPILIVPGLGGSGPEHWQSRWQRSYRRTQRVEQADWDRPVRLDWLHRLAEALRTAPGALLVGHSLGCALIAHLAWRRPDLSIGGALLVAPADLDRDDRTPREVRDFAPMPLARLPFRAVVVASTNDPYMAIERARALSQAWGARLVNAGACGHINVAAGFGPWPAGEKILAELMRESGLTANKASLSRDMSMRAS